MMKPLVRATAAVLVAALSAACSNNDPTAPRSLDAARSNPAGPVHSGYVVTWGGKDGGTGGTTGAGVGTPPGGTIGGRGGDHEGGGSTNSGYVVTWGRDGQNPPPSGK